VLLAGVGVAVFPTPRAYAGRCIAACAELVSTGTAQGGPKLSLTASDGSAVRLTDLRGRVVVVNFWATWCAPCVKEMPWLAEMQRSLGAQGLSIVGVSMDEDGWKTVRPFLAARDIPYPVALHDSGAVAGFGNIEALPATVVIGRDGRLVSTHQGIIDPAVFRSAIEQELRRR
jgi:cytochrome c biogenesis protein CcmG/thiol:disulfide interchange protein DsbE